MSAEAILAYLSEYRAFDAAHRTMIQAMAGRGTLGITAADVAQKEALTRLQDAWMALTAEERIGLQPPPMPRLPLDRIIAVIANLIVAAVIVLLLLDPGRDLTPIFLMLAVAVVLWLGPVVWRWGRK
jgi:hypothetical protein